MTRAAWELARAVAVGRLEIADAWYDAAIMYARPEPRKRAALVRESIQVEIDDIDCELAALDQAEAERGAP